MVSAIINVTARWLNTDYSQIFKYIWHLNMFCGYWQKRSFTIGPVCYISSQHCIWHTFLLKNNPFDLNSSTSVEHIWSSVFCLYQYLYQVRNNRFTFNEFSPLHQKMFVVFLVLTLLWSYSHQSSSFLYNPHQVKDMPSPQRSPTSDCVSKCW